MLFKNATIFRLDRDSARALDSKAAPEAIKRRALKPCGKLEIGTQGWVSPYGRGEDALLVAYGAQQLLALGKEDKLLPRTVINVEVANQIDALAEKRGRPVGGRERRRITEEVIHSLLPQAFVKPSRVYGYVDAKAEVLVIDTASRKAAEGFIAVLRESLDGFHAVPFDADETPRSVMSGWLTGTKLPKGLALGGECELKDPVDQGAVVRCQRQDLESDEVREHLKSGKLVTRLGVVVDGQVSLVVGEDLVLRKLRFLDTAAESTEGDAREGVVAEIDARFHVTALTLTPLVARLGEWFGAAKRGARD